MRVTERDLLELLPQGPITLGAGVQFTLPPDPPPPVAPPTPTSAPEPEPRRRAFATVGRLASGWLR